MFLGNNADDFMTKEMPITVTTQEKRAQDSMAAPRDTARVDTETPVPPVVEPPRAAMANSMLPGMGSSDMLPGMGNSDMLPGMGNGDMLPGMGFMDKLTSPMGLLIAGGAAFYLFGTKGGKKLRKSIGLG